LRLSTLLRFELQPPILSGSKKLPPEPLFAAAALV
jgi:hypothetical protein